MDVRKHQLVDCSVRLFAAIWEETVEGEQLCKFHQLRLAGGLSPILVLSGLTGGAGEADGYYIRPLLNLPW